MAWGPGECREGEAFEGWLSRSCRATLDCTTAVGNRILVSVAMELPFRIEDSFKETGSTWLSRANISLPTGLINLLRRTLNWE